VIYAVILGGKLSYGADQWKEISTPGARRNLT